MSAHQSLAREPEQEVQRLREGEDAEPRPQAEQEYRRGHEGDGVALLVPPQAGRDEPPDLPQHDGQGESEPDEGDDLQLDEEGLDRRGEDELAGAVLDGERRMGLDDGAVGLLQKGEHGGVEEPPDHPAGGDGEERDHDAAAELPEVLHERHGALRVRLLATEPPEGLADALGDAHSRAIALTARTSAGPRRASPQTPQAARSIRRRRAR
jgi:hypothetical protein